MSHVINIRRVRQRTTNVSQAGNSGGGGGGRGNVREHIFAWNAVGGKHCYYDTELSTTSDSGSTSPTSPSLHQTHGHKKHKKHKKKPCKEHRSGTCGMRSIKRAEELPHLL